MPYDFNVDEIFEMAEQIERNGAKFYRTAADSTDDPQARELLLGFAKMEDEHEKAYALLRAELVEKETTFYDPENEAALYLRAIADTRVFFEKEIDTSTTEKILKAAILAEKDSIVFYLGMKDLVPSDQEKAKVERIIKEEMVHIRILSKKLSALRK
jgi:rubrerythrin